MIDSSVILKRTPEVLQTDVNDMPVLLHTIKWKYLHFDRIGGVIWQLLETPMSLDMMVPLLQKQFAVDEATCREDSSKLLQILLDENFLVAEEPAEAKA